MAQIHSSIYGSSHFVNVPTIILFFPQHPHMLHALVHRLLDPVESSHVTPLIPFLFFHPDLDSLIICHMHQLLGHLSLIQYQVGTTHYQPDNNTRLMPV